MVIYMCLFKLLYDCNQAIVITLTNWNVAAQALSWSLFEKCINLLYRFLSPATLCSSICSTCVQLWSQLTQQLEEGSLQRIILWQLHGKEVIHPHGFMHQCNVLHLWLVLGVAWWSFSPLNFHLSWNKFIWVVAGCSIEQQLTVKSCRSADELLYCI